MADVFISYRNTPDRRAIVRRLAAILRAHEVTVWWDYGLEAGESYRAQITAELAKARVVAPLWCAESVVSKWVQMEAELGKDKLVPARLQKVVPPDAFEAIQAADLVGWDGAVGAPRILAFVRRICERLGRSALAPTDMIEELAHLPLVAPLPDVAPIVPPPSAPGHDYAFWKSEWDAHRSGTDLGALRAIADHAPPYFASQAQIRIAEIEGDREAAQIMQHSPLATRLVKFKTDQPTLERRYRAEGRIRVDAATFWPRQNEEAQSGWLKPGAGKTEWFKDVNIGPEMVVVPGNPHFAIGRYTVTFAEWDAAQNHPEWQALSGISPRKPNDFGWGRGTQPLVDVSWEDAKAYCHWLSSVTSKAYRLPSEAEWEQACRAGSKSAFWWGDDISTDRANYAGIHAFKHNPVGQYRRRTVPVATFEANDWGLYQVHGNVWEWCESAYATTTRIVKGGAWTSRPIDLRSTDRDRYVPDFRESNIGFRVARVLNAA